MSSNQNEPIAMTIQKLYDEMERDKFKKLLNKVSISMTKLPHREKRERITEIVTKFHKMGKEDEFITSIIEMELEEKKPLRVNSFTSTVLISYLDFHDETTRTTITTTTTRTNDFIALLDCTLKYYFMLIEKGQYQIRDTSNEDLDMVKKALYNSDIRNMMMRFFFFLKPQPRERCLVKKIYQMAYKKGSYDPKSTVLNACAFFIILRNQEKLIESCLSKYGTSGARFIIRLLQVIQVLALRVESSRHDEQLDYAVTKLRTEGGLSRWALESYFLDMCNGFKETLLNSCKRLHHSQTVKTQTTVTSNCALFSDIQIIFLE